MKNVRGWPSESGIAVLQYYWHRTIPLLGLFSKYAEHSVQMQKSCRCTTPSEIMSFMFKLGFFIFPSAPVAECICGGQLDSIPRTVVIQSPAPPPPAFSPFTSVSWQEGYLHHCPEPKVSMKKRTCEYFYEENPNCKWIALLKKIIETTFLFKVRLMWKQIPDCGTCMM